MNGRTNGWTTDEKADRLADGQPAWWAHGRTERRKYERPSTSWVGESWCADGWTDGWEDIYTDTTLTGLVKALLSCLFSYNTSAKYTLQLY